MKIKNKNKLLLYTSVVLMAGIFQRGLSAQMKKSFRIAGGSFARTLNWNPHKRNCSPLTIHNLALNTYKSEFCYDDDDDDGAGGDDDDVWRNNGEIPLRMWMCAAFCIKPHNVSHLHFCSAAVLLSASQEYDARTAFEMKVNQWRRRMMRKRLLLMMRELLQRRDCFFNLLITLLL